jgi:adenylate cyclase
MVASATFAGKARPERPQLPERVEAAIRAEQDRSEVLIGWIQLAVITTFAVLYFIAPRPAGAAGYITAAAIAIYLVLTVARLVISYSFSMPAWMLALSVVFDMTLLFALIWSFHVQYAERISILTRAPPVPPTVSTAAHTARNSSRFKARSRAFKEPLRRMR